MLVRFHGFGVGIYAACLIAVGSFKYTVFGPKIMLCSLIARTSDRHRFDIELLQPAADRYITGVDPILCYIVCCNMSWGFCIYCITLLTCILILWSQFLKSTSNIFVGFLPECIMCLCLCLDTWHEATHTACLLCGFHLSCPF